jgi:hypothetical protein
MNFYDKALQDNPGQAIHIRPTVFPHNYVDVKDGSIMVKKRDTYRVAAQNRQLLYASPNSTIAAAALNSGQCDIALQPGLINAIDFCFVRLDLLNSTGSALVLAPAQLLIQRIDIFAENGSNLLTSVYGLELYLGNAFLSRNEFENFAPSLGLTTAYASAATSIADTVATTLYIPIFQPFYPAKLHPNALAGNLLFRIYFNPQAITTVSGGLITTTDVSLVISGRQQAPFIQDKQAANYYLEKPLALTYMNIQRMSQTMTLAASNTYSVLMSGIKGICSVLMFTIRAAALTAANQLTFIQVLDFDILNQDGSSSIGFYRRDNADAVLDYACCFDNLMRSKVNINVVSYTPCPIEDYASGAINGYASFSSFEKLSFTTLSTLAGGSYQIDVVAFCFDEIIIKKGRATSTRA